MEKKISNYSKSYHTEEYGDYMSMYDDTVYGYCLSNTKNRRKLIKDISFNGYIYSKGWLHGGTIRRFIDINKKISSKSRKAEDYKIGMSEYHLL